MKAKEAKRGYTAAWFTSKHPLAVAARKKGVTQRALAAEAGIEQADISRVICGVRPRFAAGTAGKLYPVVKKWGVKMEDLILSHGA